MELKDKLNEIGKEPFHDLTYEEIEPELLKVIESRADDYSKSFLNARKAEAQKMAREYLRDNPRKKNEEFDAYRKRVEDFIKDYIDQAPDEFLRNLRTYCHMGTALWNQVARLNAQMTDFMELYAAVNEKAISEYAERHKDEILKQQEAIAQAKVNQERHERAVANKLKLDKKLGKK